MKRQSRLYLMMVFAIISSAIIGCTAATPSIVTPGVSEEAQATETQTITLVEPTKTAQLIEVVQTEVPTQVPTVIPTGSTKGGQVTEAVSTDAISFHIYQTTDITSRDFQFRVYASGLWRRDPSTNLPIPYMAKSWDISEDGTIYTFHLRDDMKWSDGEPITANDFVWTFEHAANKENNYPYISVLNDITSYVAKDDFTLEVTIAQPACTSILNVGQITPLPKHVWEKYPWGDPEKNPEILHPSVVSGPWMLKEWKHDEYAIFTPNKSYFDGVPYLDQYIIRIVPDQSIQFQLLKNGEVDFAPVSPADYKAAVDSDNLSLYSWDPAQPTWYFIAFNFKRPTLQEVNFRRALSYAIPRQVIADKVFNGLAKSIFSTYSPPNWVYNSDVPKYDYSIDKAKEVLDSAGYNLDAEGKRTDLEGNPITLKFYYRTGDNQREQIVLIALEEYKKLGIEVEAIAMESQALYEFLQKEPDSWDLWIGLSRDTSDPHFMLQAWMEEYIPEINTGAYINKDVETLFIQGNQPPCDVNRRKQIYQEIQQIISEDSPYVFLVYNTGYAFVNKRVVVNQPSILGINYNQNEWYIIK